MKSITIEEAKGKLLEINELVKQLDDSMRATALQVLFPLYFPTLPELQKKTSALAQEDTKTDVSAQPDTSDLGNFISSFEQSKPADNVILLVAWLYSHYGAYPIAAKEIQELGDTCGLVIPGRPDNTMRSAKNEGKTLFKQEGKGWRLTVSGELYIKQQFNIKKGNNPLPKD
jgi:hypothetical protein